MTSLEPNKTFLGHCVLPSWVMSDPPKQRKMLIGTVYQIPSGKVQSAIDILDNNLAALESTEPMAECVIMGDSNIDYKKSGSA